MTGPDYTAQDLVIRQPLTLWGAARIFSGLAVIAVLTAAVSIGTVLPELRGRQDSAPGRLLASAMSVTSRSPVTPHPVSPSSAVGTLIVFYLVDTPEQGETASALEYIAHAEGAAGHRDGYRIFHILTTRLEDDHLAARRMFDALSKRDGVVAVQVVDIRQLENLSDQ